MTPLSQWLAAPGPGDDLVAFGREGDRRRAALRADVAALSARLAPAAGERLAVHAHDAYALAVALLAAGQVGARAVLPPSRQPGALRRLAGEVVGFVLDGDDASGAIEGRPRWPALGAARAGAEPPALRAMDREAPWIELFTSGTTGAEKPVVKAVRHLEDEVAVLEARFGDGLGPGTRILSSASGQHLYGLLFRVLWPLVAGRPFLRTSPLRPEELAPSMDAERETGFALASTPVALRRAVERDLFAGRAGACRAVFSSGGPLGADVAARIAAALGSPPFEVYGSTETGGVAVRRQWRGDEPWEPLPSVATTVEPDGARLAVTSPFVSGGEPVGGDAARLVTGDRADALPDGRFHLGGRVDRTVKIAEKRLSLPDMESRLREHAGVAEAALVRVEGAGEPRVAAVVEPTAAGRRLHAEGGRRALARELSEHLASDFDRVLLPRIWRVVDALPRDAQGKCSERALRAVVESGSADAARRPREPEWHLLHRAPDLVVVEGRVPDDLAFLEGHFPGRPLVAGVVQLHWVMAWLERALGAPPRLEALEALKFHEGIEPGAHVRLELEIGEAGRSFRFRLVAAEPPGADACDAADSERVHASGRGRLAGPA